MTVPTWRCGRFEFDLRDSLVMGVVNVTPDSFSDGGLWIEPEAAVEHGLRLAAAGAAVVDVGGESTRPGAAPVPVEEELSRVRPVVARLATEGLCVSIDTRRAAVAAAALEAGASVVNDVSGGADPGMFGVCARHGCGVVLMHMRGEPATMHLDPRYSDVVAEVADHLRDRLAAAESHGIEPARVALDPGFGFGKTLGHNLSLLAATDTLAALGRPLVIGTSRKSMFGSMLDLPVAERVEATLATSVWSLLSGACVLRVHDVAETVQATAVVDAVRRCLGVDRA